MAISDELNALGRYRVGQCLRIASADPSDGINAATLLAIGSRETLLQNIVGGGSFDDAGKWHTSGTDRGVWQLSMGSHAGFLGKVPGCKSGKWTPAAGHTAAEIGYVPQFSTACSYVTILRAASVQFAIDQGVLHGERVRFAIAAHNAGNAGALRGYKEGDVDKYTTKGDYSADVLVRRGEVDAWLSGEGL